MSNSGAKYVMFLTLHNDFNPLLIGEEVLIKCINFRILTTDSSTNSSPLVTARFNTCAAHL